MTQTWSRIGRTVFIKHESSWFVFKAMKYRQILFLKTLGWMWLITAVDAGTITPSPYWKNQADFPDDPFLASANPFGGRPLPGFIKFIIFWMIPRPSISRQSGIFISS
jgi:hypothetical protein